MANIHLENVNLDYLVKTGNNSLKQTALGYTKKIISNADISHLKNSSYRALKDINLTLKKNDRLALIGGNGAGKSSLLRVLASIYTPTSGKVIINGSISTLFDINIGMNLEATGYENIIILGITRGKTRAEMIKMIPHIVDFTELGDFLNAPVRTYSSGMLMRLAFAVITSLHSDIILIDEIIGVGDTHFMEKAQKKLEDLIDRSEILALTSHSENILKRFCNKAIVLKEGVIVFQGEISSGIQYYQKNYHSKLGEKHYAN